MNNVESFEPVNESVNELVPNTDLEHNFWLDRLSRMFRRPQGRALMLSLCLLGLGLKGDRKVSLKPEVSFEVRNTTIDFKELANFNPPVPERPILISNEVVAEVITRFDSENNTAGLTNNTRVEDEPKFDHWVEDQLSRPEIKKLVGLTKEGALVLTPRQAAEAATAIVVANLSIDTALNAPSADDKTGAGSVYINDAADQATADELLMGQGPKEVACRNMAVATVEVYDSLKRQSPKSLTNTYLGTVESPDHLWNMVAQVEKGQDGREKIEAAFIDPALADHAWDMKDSYKRDFVDLLDNLVQMKVASEATALELASDYFLQHETRPAEEWTYLNKTIAFTPEQSGNLTKIIQHFLKRPRAQIEQANLETGTDTVLVSSQKLRDIFLDPENYARPDDWLEQSKSLTGYIADHAKSPSVQSDSTLLLERFPGTPEAYFRYRYEQEMRQNYRLFSNLPKSVFLDIQKRAEEHYHENMTKISDIRFMVKSLGKESIWWRK